MNLFGESILFVALAGVVFLCASAVESFCVIDQITKCRVAENAINHLTKNSNPTQGYIFKNEDVKNEQVWNWIKEHIAGSAESNDKYKPNIENHRFVLIKYPHVLAQSIPRSPLSFVSTLLTAIGLLGTFWGISTGLSKFDLNAIKESENLLTASIGVLTGMKTAFFSSLVGLGCASVFMVVLFACNLARKIIRDRLRHKLDKIAVLSTSEVAEQNIAFALSKAAQTMTGLTSKSIGEEVGKSLKPVFEEISKELSILREIKAEQGQEMMKVLIQGLRTDVILPIADRLDESAKLTQEASKAVMNLQAELGSVSKNLADSILTIQHFQKETLGRLEDFAGGLKETLGQFQTETRIVLKEVAQEIKFGVEQSIEGMEAQRIAFADSAQNVTTTFRGIRKDLEAALHTQADIEKQMLTDVEARMTNILQTSHTAFQTQTITLATLGSEASGLMNNARENLVVSFQNIDGTLRNTMEAQRTAFAESTTNAADTFRGIREDLQAALHTQAEVEKQMLTDVEARMTNILQTSHTAFQTQSETLETLGSQASGLMNNAKDNLVGSLQNIDGMLQNTRQTVQEELEHFRQGYQASLQNFFTKQNNLLESTLGEQRQGLAQVVEDLQTAFQAEAAKRQTLGQEVDLSITKIQGTVEVVSNLASTVGLNSGARMAQIQELSHGMGKQVRELESAYNNLANQFSESLQKGDDRLTKYLHQTKESNIEFFTQADEATAKLCNNLLLAASYLVAAEDNNRRDRGAS